MPRSSVRLFLDTTAAPRNRARRHCVPPRRCGRHPRDYRRGMPSARRLPRDRVIRSRQSLLARVVPRYDSRRCRRSPDVVREIRMLSKSCRKKAGQRLRRRHEDRCDRKPSDRIGFLSRCILGLKRAGSPTAPVREVRNFVPILPGSRTMRVLVTGATGYIGGRLVPALLAAGHAVRCFARDPGGSTAASRAFEIARGDVFDERFAARGAARRGRRLLSRPLDDGRPARFHAAAIARPRGFSAARRAAGGRQADRLPRRPRRRRSAHGALASPAQPPRSRRDLRAGGVPVTEFRAAIIVGSGSVSFEMLRYLTERLPVMIAPKWVRTRCQPIGVRDVIAYLAAALAHARERGPDRRNRRRRRACSTRT